MTKKKIQNIVRSKWQIRIQSSFTIIRFALYYFCHICQYSISCFVVSYRFDVKIRSDIILMHILSQFDSLAYSLIIKTMNQLFREYQFDRFNEMNETLLLLSSMTMVYSPFPQLTLYCSIYYKWNVNAQTLYRKCKSKLTISFLKFVTESTGMKTWYTDFQKVHVLVCSCDFIF